ncbi:MAG TPA: putative inorganic carbon transporter subunit DabA, partial [Rhodospirillales bacterium]|nr:putative inorganic carbon transporter subunit DabA [Rhodospirillales bacterium]
QPSEWLESILNRRAEDWSEVRPEWALARNAAFIAARRGRSLGLNLDGRSFLHEYDADADPEDAVLTLILIAPMVVASWINLQYFGSTVDNHIFGCGNKTLHNRVGGLGVVVGNGGDMRTGLAQQSVHAADGSWFHEPMRLQVVIEAACDRIDGVLEAHSGVRDLVENGWVRLVALSPSGTGMWRRLADGVWEPVGETAEAGVAA